MKKTSNLPEKLQTKMKETEKNNDCTLQDVVLKKENISKKELMRCLENELPELSENQNFAKVSIFVIGSDTSEKSDEAKTFQVRLESSLANLIQDCEKVARL